MLKLVKLQIDVPSSKSLTQRAFLANYLSGNKGKVINPLVSEDTNYFKKAIDKGLGGKVYLGNNGTALRLLLPHLKEGTIVDGNKYLRTRPIKELVEALEDLGYEIKSNNGYLPLKIISKNIIDNEVIVDASMSSQFLSSLMMLGSTLKNGLLIKVRGELISKPYVDLTLDLLKQYGIKVENYNYKIFTIKPQRYKKVDYRIESDFSSASYFLTYNFISDSQIKISNLNLKSKQGDLNYIKALDDLKGGKTEFDFNAMPDMVMSMAVAAIFTNKKISINNIANLRVKETDRLKALNYNLNKIRIKNKIGEDYIVIWGTGGKYKNIKIKTFNDHRIAMALGILGLGVDNPNCVAKSYPDFWKDLEKIKEGNVVLTGMRGTGKTYWGKKYAKEWGMSFIDFDEEIEKLAKKKVSEIVEERGWKYFRELEYKITKKYSNSKNTVIATGGGTLMHKRNYDLLKNNFIILLETDIKTIKNRIKNSKNRPALTNKDFIRELKDIYRKRKNKYLKIADKVIKT